MIDVIRKAKIAITHSKSATRGGKMKWRFSCYFNHFSAAIENKYNSNIIPTDITEISSRFLDINILLSETRRRENG